MGYKVVPLCMAHYKLHSVVATTLNIGAVGFFVGLVKYDFVTLYWYQVQGNP